MLTDKYEAIGDPILENNSPRTTNLYASRMRVILRRKLAIIVSNETPINRMIAKNLAMYHVGMGHISCTLSKLSLELLRVSE